MQEFPKMICGVIPASLGRNAIWVGAVEAGGGVTFLRLAAGVWVSSGGCVSRCFGGWMVDGGWWMVGAGKLKGCVVTVCCMITLPSPPSSFLPFIFSFFAWFLIFSFILFTQDFFETVTCVAASVALLLSVAHKVIVASRMFVLCSFRLAASRRCLYHPSSLTTRAVYLLTFITSLLFSPSSPGSLYSNLLSLLSLLFIYFLILPLSTRAILIATQSPPLPPLLYLFPDNNTFLTPPHSCTFVSIPGPLIPSLFFIHLHRFPPSLE